MASGWVKALQCRSNALEDVYQQPPFSLPLPPTPRKHKPPSSSTTTACSSPKKVPLLPLGCGNTPHALRDVVLHFPKKPSSHPTTKLKSHPPPPPKPKPRSKGTKTGKPGSHHRPSSKPTSPSPVRHNPSPFPTLTDLPPGHSSRRVVEIIFSSSWSRSGAADPFPGEIEMLFKVHNPSRTVARFEEYREAVRSRAGPDDARCAADGNEMMRFHSATAGPATTISGEPIYDAGAIWSNPSTGGIKTFSGSGGAHDRSGSGGGVARGKRRAMLVCRVIAGRIRTGSEPGSENYESVSVGKGELLVFDPRAVLPCFLIIYKI